MSEDDSELAGDDPVPPENESSGSNPLDAIAEGYLAARARGEAPSIDELARRHPEQAERIRELFPVLEMLEAAGEESASEAPGEEPMEREFGDYRIEGELGRGGMGVVYEAVQKSLDRRVALKVLPGYAHLDPRHLQRFRREAQAAARLRHPNIVPVFEVGEEGGVQYYAMQLIEGIGLDEVLVHVRSRFSGSPPPQSGRGSSLSSQLASKLLGERLVASRARTEEESGESDADVLATSAEIAQPRYFENVARIGVQVARALAYAHGEGVLHRDIKPSNLLLDRRGTTWIADFGLAKAEGSDAITHSGDVLGTPRYLAPESLSGWSDPRTDVWGLGVTLYELLTLAPAFRGEDRAELLRRIAEEEPVPPRRIDRRIPRDLETVVLAAIEKEPARRYGGAAELADDLERFVAGMPILARRASWLHRCGLFLRRHRLATAVAGAALALLVGLVLVWAFTLQEARRNLEASLRRERATRGRAEENFHLALDAVQRMQIRLGAERLAGEPRLEQLRREVLEDAVRFYREFLARRGEDPQVRYEAALCWARLGSLEFLLDRGGEAEKSLREAELLLRELGGDPARRSARAVLAGVLANRGRLLYSQLRIAEARPIVAELMTLIGELTDGEDVADASISSLVAAFEFAGRFQKDELGSAQALATLDRGSRLGLRYLQGDQRDPLTESMVRYWVHNCLLACGQISSSSGKYEDAERYLRRSREVVSALTSAAGSPERLHALAQSDSILANVLEKTERLAAAETAYRAALKGFDQLVADYPSVGRYQAERSQARVFLGLLLRKTGRFKEATTLLEEAIGEYDAMVQGEKSSIERRRLLAVAWITLGTLRWNSDPQGAGKAFRVALERLEELRAQVPDFEDYEDGVAALALAEGNLGTLLTRSPAAAEGERRLRRSLEFYRLLVKAHPGNIHHSELQILMDTNLGGYLRAAGRREEAETLLREGRDLGVAALARAPTSRTLASMVASARHKFGNLLKDLQRYDEAERELRAEIELREEILKWDPQRPQVHSDLGAALNDLALILECRKRFEEMIPLLERAATEQERALAKSPAHPVYGKYLVYHLISLARAAEACGRLDKALDADRRVTRLKAVDAEMLLLVAKQICRCAKGKGGALNETASAEALGVLQRAIEQGLRDSGRLEADSDLEPLRALPAFRDLIERMR